mmetsp:Transcript_62724/g.147048  ORF Transcript_62724/g.147048 Transcript_62724/m.147048 type:complete len:90 (-) Transcript_62724:2-271(-)
MICVLAASTSASFNPCSASQSFLQGHASFTIQEHFRMQNKAGHCHNAKPQRCREQLKKGCQASNITRRIFTQSLRKEDRSVRENGPPEP